MMTMIDMKARQAVKDSETRYVGGNGEISGLCERIRREPVENTNRREGR